MTPISTSEATSTSKAPSKGSKATSTSKSPRQVCGAPTKAGGHCSQSCLEGKQTCTDHRPALDHLTVAEREAWDKWVARQTPVTLIEELGWHRAKAIVTAGAGAGVRKGAHSVPGGRAKAA